jgi:hypothetical protein
MSAAPLSYIPPPPHPPPHHHHHSRSLTHPHSHGQVANNMYSPASPSSATAAGGYDYSQQQQQQQQQYVTAGALSPATSAVAAPPAQLPAAAQSPAVVTRQQPPQQPSLQFPPPPHTHTQTHHSLAHYPLATTAAAHPPTIANPPLPHPHLQTHPSSPYHPSPLYSPSSYPSHPPSVSAASPLTASPATVNYTSPATVPALDGMAYNRSAAAVASNSTTTATATLPAMNGGSSSSSIAGRSEISNTNGSGRPKRRRKSPVKWEEFYRNGVPKEIIVIDSSPEPDDEPRPHSLRENLLNSRNAVDTVGNSVAHYGSVRSPPAHEANSRAYEQVAKHAAKRRRTNGNATGGAYAAGFVREDSISDSSPYRNGYGSSNSTERTNSALNTTAPTSLGSYRSAGDRVVSNGTKRPIEVILDDEEYASSTAATGNKRKRTKRAVEESRPEAMLNGTVCVYHPPPNPVIKAREVHVAIGKDVCFKNSPFFPFSIYLGLMI